MSAEDPRDPRFRNYRRVTLAVYLVISCGFSALIIGSVYQSVLQMTPELPEAAGPTSSEAECLGQARGLFEELELQRKGLVGSADVTHADQRFLDFRVEWLTRKRAIEARCGLESREKVRGVYRTLERLLDLYTTASVQFTGGVGPVTDELKRQLELKP